MFFGPLLHNMGCRREHRVSWEIASLARPIVGFRRVAMGRRDRSLPAADERARLSGLLEERWGGYGLNGALFVYPISGRFGPGSVEGPDFWAADPLLILNVLGRSHGNLLLPAAPMYWDPSRLSRALASNDPRLVALARDPAPGNPAGSGRGLTAGLITGDQA